MQITVYYEDTDLGGVVYHSQYLKFCERARSELFFAKGKSPEMENGHLLAKSLKANYIKPAFFADTLDVKTELLALRGASFTLLQSIYRGGEKIFEMRFKAVYLTYDGKVGRIDSAMRAMLKSLKD